MLFSLIQNTEHVRNSNLLYIAAIIYFIGFIYIWTIFFYYGKSGNRPLNEMIFIPLIAACMWPITFILITYWNFKDKK